MKIAVLSDIHGNYEALEQVLMVAKKKGVSRLLVLGDVVGYYYYPDKVMDLLNEWNYDLIKGNHENILIQLKEGLIQLDEIKNKYGSGHKIALEKLSTTHLKTLLNADSKKHICIDGLNLLMCHGSNFDSEFYIYPDSSEDILKKCNEPLIDFVLIGHSHYQFIYKNKDSMLINVGSVGQSRLIGGIANWLFINTENKCFEMMATTYSVNNLLADVKRIDPDVEYLQSVLTRTII